MLHNSNARKKVLLLGSGHSHLEILKILSKDEMSKNQFVMISPERESHYTGLIPRLIAGDFTAEDLTIPSADYAEAKGFDFIKDTAVAIDEVQKIVILASGRKISFDLLSINVGGIQRRENQINSELSLYLRPFAEFLKNWQKLQQNLKSQKQLSFVVLGGGAAAVEVATALQIWLSKLYLQANDQSPFEIHVVAKGTRLCPNYEKNISQALEKNLQGMGIQVHLNQEILSSSPHKIYLKENLVLPVDQVFLATPTIPAQLAFGKADKTLQLSPCIFAAGDCVLMEDFPELPRSGVIAVHQGRHLAINLQRVLAGKETLKYTPAVHQLNILICGPKTALAVWGKWSYQGYLPWLLKKWIDERYMRSFKIGF